MTYQGFEEVFLVVILPRGVRNDVEMVVQDFGYDEVVQDTTAFVCKHCQNSAVLR